MMDLKELMQKDVSLELFFREQKLEAVLLKHDADGVWYWISDYPISKDLFASYPLLKEKLRGSILSIYYDTVLKGELSFQKRFGGYKEPFVKVKEAEVTGMNLEQILKKLEEYLKLIQKRNLFYSEQEILLALYGNIGDFLKIQMENGQMREYWISNNNGILKERPGEWIPDYYLLQYDAIREVLEQNRSLLLKCLLKDGVYEVQLMGDAQPLYSFQDKHIKDTFQTLSYTLKKSKK